MITPMIMQQEPQPPIQDKIGSSQQSKSFTSNRQHKYYQGTTQDLRKNETTTYTPVKSNGTIYQNQIWVRSIEIDRLFWYLSLVKFNSAK